MYVYESRQKRPPMKCIPNSTQAVGLKEIMPRVREDQVFLRHRRWRRKSAMINLRNGQYGPFWVDLARAVKGVR